MARTAVAYSAAIVNGSLADPGGTAITAGAGNGGQIAAAAPELTLLRVANASGGSGTVTVKAGTQPSAISSGQGDLVSGAIATGTSLFVGPFESARFGQPDGSLIVESSVAVTVTAFKVPRH
jgi:hypothetical protein